MTGIERLRQFAKGCRIAGQNAYSNDITAIADQIEREQGGRVSRMRVLAVVTEMERHVLGHEGMEDSPVALWARELREALGGDGRDPAADVSMSAYELLPQEDREAIAWVRERGGLERVKAQRREFMPRAAYERKKAGFLDHIAECERALGRRRDAIARLANENDALRLERAQMRPRLMPEGMEWPRYDDGEPVPIGGEFMGKDGKTYTAKQIQFIGKCFSLYDFCGMKPQFSGFYGERVKRPAVLAADGEPMEVGQTVYATHYGYVKCTVLAIEWDVDGYLVEVENEGGHKFRQTPDEFTHQRPVLDADGVEIREDDRVWSTHLDEPHEWIVIDPHEDRDDSQTVLVSIGDRTGHARPSDLTHRAPVLAADGKPLREGEHVYHVETGAELVVKELPKPGEYQAVVVFAPPASHLTSFDPDQLTHERPDSWERLEEDARNIRTALLDSDKLPFEVVDERALDLVRRAKALAERERGE